MLLLVPLIFLSFYIPRITPNFLSENLLNLSRHLHQICLSFSSPGPYSELYKGLSCGTTLSSNLYPIFANSGLLHLIIISGLHISLLYKNLNFIQKDILFIPKKLAQSLSLLGLLLYTLMLNILAPALRACCFQIIKIINNKYKLNWPPSCTILFSILLSLAFKPSLWNSISLLLSWVAIIIIYFIQQALTHPLMPTTYKQPLIKNICRSVFLYLFLFPLLSQFNSIHPLSILLQLLLTPLLLFILIPLSIFQYFLFPPIINIDFLWNIFFLILKPIQYFIPNGETIDRISLTYFWIYALSLQFLLIVFETYNRQLKLSIKNKLYTANTSL